MRVQGGDRGLGTIASSVVQRWRFLPALDAERQPVRQAVRLLAVAGAPASKADSVALYARAKREDAQFILVANALPAIEERFIAHDHERVRMVSFGEAPRILFLHGPGDSAEDWGAVAAALAPAISSAAYDLRGHGASRRDDGGDFGDFSIDSHVADLERVVDSLNLARPILVTYDASAAIAAEFARRHPERVTALAMISPMQDGAKASLSSRVMSMRGLLLRMSVAERRSGFTYRAMWEDPDPRRLIEERAERVLPPATRSAVIQTLVSALNYDLTAALAEYSGPIYVLEARSANELASAFAIDLFAAVGRGDSTAKRLIVRNLDGGPWPMVSTPKAVAAQLRSIAGDVR